MTTILRKRSPGAAAAPLMHWLVLVCGLAVLTVQRADVLPKVVPLWVGAVAGTLLGQFLGARRVRLWLLLFMAGNAMWCGAIVSAPLWLALFSGREVGQCVELCVLSFGPAAICGYFSLSERGGLQAFWFPAVLWTVALLDGNGGATLEGTRGWLLLAALSALFVAFLHAREARRVALWKSHATFSLAAPPREATLREAPLRRAAPVAWIAGLGVATLALTAWIAPHLWQKDRLGNQRVRAPSLGTEVTGVPGSPDVCCSETTPVEVNRSQVRELFDVLSTQDGHPPSPPPTTCIPCPARVASREAGTMASVPGGSTSVAGQPGAPGAAPGTGTAPLATAAGAPLPARTLPKVATVTKPVPPGPPPPRTLAEAPRPVHPPLLPKTRAATTPVPPPRSPPKIAAAVPVLVPPSSDPPFAWLVGLALAGVLAQIALRPLRRFLTLRHLRRPLWAETVDQRVSNLWQLALVGLRDLGWRPVPGEQPQEMARRTGLSGMGTCASVLERVRHGVRVDAGDLEAMERAAESVYEAARRQAGWTGRAAGWVRWPLV